MDDCRVALIGFGYAGRVFHAPLIGATQGLRIAAVASSRPDTMRAALGDVAVEATPEAAIARDDIDLVVIATPNDRHAPLAMAALDAGKHVVVDKPFALTLADAAAVVDAARRAKRLVSVFHNRRWDSDFLTVAAAIARGDLGQVVHFESHFDRFRPQVRDRWRERRVPGGGIWYDLGPHLIDQAVHLFGMPERIEADLAVLRPGGQADDWAHAVLAYPDKRVIVHASMLSAGGSPRFVVHGTGGTLVKAMPDQQEAQLLAGMIPGVPGWGEDPDPAILHDGAGSRAVATVSGDQRRFYRGVVAAIRGEGPNPVPPEEALATMSLIEAGLRASAERHAVTPALPANVTMSSETPWRLEGRPPRP